MGALMTEFARKGVRFHVEPSGGLRAAGALTGDLRDRIRTDKPAILSELATGRYATPAEAAELRGLLDILLADVPEQIEWSLGIASADPDAALMSFRALVADMRDRGTLVPPPDIPR